MPLSLSGRWPTLAVLLIATALVLVLQPAAQTAAEQLTGQQVMERSKDTKQSETQVSEITMLLIDKKNKQQTRSIKIWAVQKGNESKTLTRFTAPKSVSGVGFLALGEGEKAKRWLYMPRTKKTRMIAEGDKNKSFMGTDFTYYDLSPHDVDGSIYEPVEDATHEGIACYKVSGRSRDLDASLYSKVVQWVRKDNYVPIRVDFYDKDGELLKRSTVLDLENIDGNWTPMKMQMHNLQINHKTVMTIDKVEYDTKIPSRYFNKSNLEKGR